MDGDVIPSPTTWRDYAIPGSRFAEIMRMIDEGMTDEEIGAIYKPQMEVGCDPAETIAIYRKVHDGKLTPPEGTPFHWGDPNRPGAADALRQMPKQARIIFDIFGHSARRCVDDDPSLSYFED
jgi:hypothetical protein